ncbi:MAG: nucleoside triphosphate pyrophosphohydrolase [Acidobacteriota bacterium]
MPSPDLSRLTDLVRRLRAPEGCPWDREQTLGDLRAYLLEEAHETAAAIDSGDSAELLAELGDLLFQASFIAVLAEEAGQFTVGDAIEHVHTKMVERHPHVFGDTQLADSAAVREVWERRKLETKKSSGGSLLDGVAPSLPALTGAYRMTQKAAGVGFDWAETDQVLEKIEEEIDELRAAADKEQRREELGDLLFTVANLARKLDIDPEAALAQANLKFRRRFAGVETGLAAQGERLGEASLETMDALWEAAKAAEPGRT